MSDSKCSPPVLPHHDPDNLPIDRLPNFRSAALEWFAFGFSVIPIKPETKTTAMYWDPWLENLSEEKILTHWEKFPNHEVGFIVGDDIIVFDADSLEAIAALTTLEWEHSLIPNLVVKTRRGEHHYFRKASGAFAKTSGHGSENPNQKIDVKTGRTMVILPPSTGKTSMTHEAEDFGDLVEVNQAFIDAVFLHKGQLAPRPSPPLSVPRPKSEPTSEKIANIEALLDVIDPGCCREDWLKVLIAIFNETGGSDDGFELADSWSSRGNNYTGKKDVLTAWRSFKPNLANPITIGTLVKMAKDNGADMEAVMDASVPQFEVCNTEIIEKLGNKPIVVKPLDIQPEGTVFDKFSLTGRSDELEREAVDQVPVLGQIALLGQLTVLYAEANTGKTLITIKLLTESIEAGLINPAKTYYLNMDDSSHGVIEKLKIAEEFEFHILAEGYQGFSAKAFLDNLRELIRDNKAQGVVVILDTLKKFVDLMKKSECRDFNVVLRQFSLKGGTVIALAHTNKNAASDGRPIYSGTTDMKDDFDCVYILSLISERGSQQRVVLFEREKSRGPVVDTVSYRYMSNKTIGYNEMFLSVQEVDENQVTSLKQAEEFRSDAEVINAVITCINEGVNSKMKLADAAAKRSGASKRSVLGLIDKYTGEDPAQHRWFFVRGERGKQTYSVLTLSTEGK